ncbi:hypothetical protein FNJ47_31725 [Bradyrhizobium sp. UFLA 03-164]|uniref:DUF2256 domain-containing protein n=1 Tax=Bradyrhizobium uaiense TaxID=2594946 RepID=A0A6P1BRN2_9BRAD|nr:hypothetical protein [Bradyrhizobium uaiense]
MPYRSESHRPHQAMRCAICDGKFGLVRHYSWRTQLCSRKCVDQFRARRQIDGNWLGWLPISLDRALERPARAA